MKPFKIILLTLAAGAIVFAAVSYYCNLPIVQESYSSQTCVKVIDPENRYSCDNLPRKYIHEWVA